MRFLAVLALAGLVVALPAAPGLAQTPAPIASPAAPALENAALTKLARIELDAFLSGKVDRTHYTAQANTQLTDAIVTQVSGIFAPAGKVTSFGYAGPGTFQGMPVVKYAVGFEKAIALPNGGSTKDFVESIAWDKDGKVTFIFFSPKGM